MAALTITEADVSLVRDESAEGPTTHPAAATFPRGAYVSLNAAGQLVPGGAAGSNGGIALRAAKVIGDSVSISRRGLMDYGTALNALAYNAPVYANATTGVLDNAANDGAATPTAYQQIGHVTAGYGLTGPSASKLLRVNVS